MRKQLLASTALVASLALITVPGQATAASCGGNYMVQDNSVDVVYSWQVDVFHAWGIETKGAVSCADARGFVRQEAERRGVHSHCRRYDLSPGNCSHAMTYVTLDGWPGWRFWGNMGSEFAWKGSDYPDKAKAHIAWNYEYPENVMCIVVNPDVVVGLGHVAWAFRDAPAGMWWYGSTDGPNVQSYLETVSGRAWDSRARSFRCFCKFQGQGCVQGLPLRHCRAQRREPGGSTGDRDENGSGAISGLSRNYEQLPHAVGGHRQSLWGLPARPAADGRPLHPTTRLLRPPPGSGRLRRVGARWNR